MIYEVWTDDMEREDAMRVEASAARHAAEKACERWHETGREMGDEVTVHVAAIGGTVLTYTVEVEMVATFHAFRETMGPS